VEDQRGNLQNPPSGCLIDSDVVEDDEGSDCFDFYLVPQLATQGCALPTHFYCAYNDSKMNKESIEKLTYDLCYYYYNWAGPIKVPAPCMYAHKIAQLFTDLGATSSQIIESTDIKNRIQESFHYL
jgi:aubergine-like protein